MITLLGATGYTGQLTAAALDQAGLPFRITGRSAERLSNLSNRLDSKPAWEVVDVGYAQSLSSLFRDTHLLINCVGPFTDLGEKILSQAAVSGVHYIDTTNELGFVYRMQSYQRLALQSNAAIVSSCAFEVALADCAVRSIKNDGDGPIDEIHIVYSLRGQDSSPGTRRSALRSLATSWVVFKNGIWTGQAPGSHARRFDYQGQRYSAFSIPSCEGVTIPAHTAVKSIYTWMTAAPVQTFFAPVVVPYFSRFLRSIAGPWIQNSIGRKQIQIGERLPSREPFEILIFTKQGNKLLRSIQITGNNPYEITARILVRAAQKISSPEFKLKGILPPSSVLGGHEFFSTAQSWGIQANGLSD